MAYEKKMKHPNSMERERYNKSSGTHHPRNLIFKNQIYCEMDSPRKKAQALLFNVEITCSFNFYIPPSEKHKLIFRWGREGG